MDGRESVAVMCGVRYSRIGCLAGELLSVGFPQIVLLTVLWAVVVCGGCGMGPGMTFEQDSLMDAQTERDFFQQPAAPQVAADRWQARRDLRTDHTEEAAYLKNIVQLLEQSKLVASQAQRQAHPRRRKLFNYAAFEVDIDTVIFAIKRYLAADDYTPRSFEALPPIQLKGRYSNAD